MLTTFGRDLQNLIRTLLEILKGKDAVAAAASNTACSGACSCDIGSKPLLFLGDTVMMLVSYSESSSCGKDNEKNEVDDRLIG